MFILDSLALYNPAAGTEAESIIERVTPRLQHANSAVVLSAIKVMIKYMDLITSQDTLKVRHAPRCRVHRIVPRTVHRSVPRTGTCASTCSAAPHLHRTCTAP